MILAFIFTAFHLSMLLTAGTDMDPYITLRGICANFLLGWCFSRAFKITRKPSLRMALFGLTAALLALSHAHVQINGSYPDIRYAGLAADRVFIYSILSDRTILWRVLIYTILTTGVFVWSETKGLEIQLTRDGKTKVLFILISAYGLGSIFPACDVSRWEASSVVDFNLHSIFFKTTSRARDVEVDGRRLIARELTIEMSQLYHSCIFSN